MAHVVRQSEQHFYLLGRYGLVIKRRLIGLLAAVPLLLAATPAHAQTYTAPPSTSAPSTTTTAPVAPATSSTATVPVTAAAPGNCQFQLGFGTIASLIPNIIGGCVTDQKMSNPQGDTMQETTNGLLTWTKATNVVEFTNGQRTWVNSGYGLLLRDGTTSYDWEGATSLVAGIAINSKRQVIDTQTGQVIPTDVRIKVG